MINAYEELANAIILRAVQDYRETYYEPTLREIERFFLSDWFTVLSDANPDMILRRLRREVKGNDS